MYKEGNLKKNDKEDIVAIDNNINLYKFIDHVIGHVLDDKA